ncbi:MAG: T9SS type A sorting domain-containing protein [Flavobacteriales bacterium]|nr:T9SS type A sorting domain-containing protein [Flavobacteriales bacterium]
MKQLYLTLGLVMASTSMLAQSRAISSALRHAPPIDLAGPRVEHRGGGTCVFSEDFEGGVLPAGWSISADVEQLDDMGNPLGTFVPPWQVGDSAATQTGDFFFVPAGMSTFAYANDDGPPCDCSMNMVWISTPSFDLSGVTGVGLQFECLNDGLYCTTEAGVDASTDGGLTWTNIYTIPEAGDPNDPVLQSITVPLAAYAGQPDVRLRWTWDDGGCWGTGLAIDNICIAELAPANLTLTESFLSDAGAFYDDYSATSQEYTHLAFEQAYPMIVGADVTNNGGADQTNVIVTAEIFEGGVSQGTFSSMPYPLLAAGTHDSIYVMTNWTPTMTGEVSVELSVAADDPDSDPSDNSGSKSMTITGPAAADGYSNMGLDANSLTGYYVMNQGGTDPGFGIRSEIQNTGSVAYGIGLAFATGTVAGAGVQATLLQLNDDGLETMAVSDLFEIEGWHIGGTGSNNIVFIPFDPILSDPNPTPVTLDPANDYISVVENPGTEEVRIGVSGTLNPGGLWSVDPADGSLIFYTAPDNPAVMIRLFLADAPVGIADLTSNGLSLGPNMPNPFTGLTTIPYTLQEAREVTFEVIDMAGKTVMVKQLGNRPAGSHLIDMDGAPLAPGAYQYALTAGQDRLARRMIVTR